jgi:pimeloyl-ACP methyl ester carboxylesterase
VNETSASREGFTRWDESIVRVQEAIIKSVTSRVKVRRDWDKCQGCQRTARQDYCSPRADYVREANTLTLQPARYRLVRLYAEEGNIVCRYYDARRATAAVLWLGGVGGGFDSPAHGLFDHLAVELLDRGISSLRVRYRHSHDLASSVEDALIALEFLAQRNVERVALVGHSFGGAVAIESGAADLNVAAVAALASQSFGTGGVSRISPRPLLLVAGDRDTILPPECSVYIYERALEPKQLVVLPGAGHCFDEVVPQLHQLLDSWLLHNLQSPG